MAKKPIRKNKPPAKTVHGRQNQLISLAVDLAEKQLAEGTASSQVVTHYLKLSASDSDLQKKKLEYEIELLKAKVDSIKSSEKIEVLYQEALDAMRSYSGHGGEEYD